MTLKKNMHILWNNEGTVFPAKVSLPGKQVFIRKMKPVHMAGFREVTFRYDWNDLREIPYDLVLQIVKKPKVVPDSR